ncbi:hypothetical protein AB0D08_31380 [Kitasatospora sp. NPDC048540]|uniref:hypothetical protein n=1 Tax=unclassified Kitasatospora TaxID=2633591 RepID=UPI00068B902C|nr:hypothetical protein [Kitasatospora sp. MBT63]
MDTATQTGTGTPCEVPEEAPAVSGAQRWARRITDGVEPKNVIIAVLPLIGVVRYGLAGLGWAAFAALFAAVLPTWFIRRGMRAGRIEDRHVGRRQRRLVVLPFVMLSVLTSLVTMVLVDAPSDLTAMVLAMFASLVPLLAVTVWWKISVHTAVTSGAVICVALALGPWWLLAYPLVGAVGWSRVVLRDHTLAQTLAGTVVGGLTAGLTFWAAR